MKAIRFFSKLLVSILLAASVLTAAQICMIRAAAAQPPPKTIEPPISQRLGASQQLQRCSYLEKTFDSPKFISLGYFTVTAYCPCPVCCGIWSAEHPCRIDTDFEQRTFSGTIPTPGRTIGVDPTVIPLGTVVYIDGHPYCAEDTGTMVRGHIVDIYFPTHAEALDWGVKYFEILVPDNGGLGNNAVQPSIDTAQDAPGGDHNARPEEHPTGHACA